MDFAFPADAERFREEVRAFLAAELTPEIVERTRRSGTVHDERFHAALARRGWVGLSWPVEHGGQGRDAFHAVALAEEGGYAGAPLDGLFTTTIVARTLMQVGTPEQRARLLGPMLRGELVVALGFTEPDAGSDVAAARTRAVRDADGWVVTGSKIFTSLAHVADYVFLLTRTDPDTPKHRGLTLFLVPLDAAGVEVRPIETLGGERTNATFYDAVRVPDDDRVGDVDGGWAVLTYALDVERGGADYAVRAQRVLDETVAWARAEPRGGRPVLADAGVRRRLARLATEVRAARLLTHRVAWAQSRGEPTTVAASMAKLYGSEVFQRVCEQCLDVFGAAGLVRVEDGESPASLVEEAWRHSKVTTIYGGTSEVQRNVIAGRALGLRRQ